MKLKIIFGIVIAIVILMTLPSVSALQSNQFEDIIKKHESILNADPDISDVLIKFKNNPHEPTFILLFLLSVIINLLRLVKFASAFVIVLLLIILKMSNNNTTYICI